MSLFSIVFRVGVVANTIAAVVSVFYIAIFLPLLRTKVYIYPYNYSYTRNVSTNIIKKQIPNNNPVNSYATEEKIKFGFVCTVAHYCFFCTIVIFLILTTKILDVTTLVTSFVLFAIVAVIHVSIFVIPINIFILSLFSSSVAIKLSTYIFSNVNSLYIIRDDPAPPQLSIYHLKTIKITN